MVSLIVSGVFALFLIIGFLIGFKRGLKRTCIRGIWLAVTVILLLFLSTNITMKLLGLPFGKWFELSVDGTTYMTLKDYLSALLESKLALDGVNYAETVNVALTIISMFINGVVFLICFWVLQLITYIFYRICNIFIFAKERKEKKRLKKEGKKLQKHRLAGAFVGLGLGLVMFFCTVTPIVGYLQIGRNVEKVSAEKSGTETGLLDEYTEGMFSRALEEYDNSIAGKTFSALGLDKAMSKILDLNSSVKVNGTRLSLSEEAENIVDIYYEIKDFEIPDLNTCTKAELDSFLNSADRIIDTLFESSVVSGCTDVLLPIGIKYARKQVKTDEYKVYVKAFINACFDELETFKSEKTKDELKGVVGLVRALNNSNMLLPIVQSSTGDTMLFFKNNLTKENSNEIVEALFKLETASELAPHVVNLLLGVGAEQVDYTYEDETTVTATALKEASLTILTSAVDVLTGVDKVDGETKLTLSSTFAGGLGGMLDAVKGLVSQNNFNNVVNSLETKIYNQFVKDVGVPDFVKNNLEKAINNLSEVSSFKSTLLNAYDVYDIINTEMKNAKVDDKYDVDKMNFSKIGKALDTMETNELFKGNILKSVLLDSLDYIEDKTVNADNPIELTCLTKIRENINANMGNGLDICWEVEFPRYKSTVSIAVNLKGTDIMSKVRQADDDTLIIIGEQLDGPLKESIILGGCDRLLVADILQYAHDKASISSDEKTNNSVKELLADAKANVQNDSLAPFNWTQEFKHIKSMLEVDFDNTTDENILVIADKLDDILFDHVSGTETIEKSKIITKTMVNNFIVDYMDQVFGEVTEEADFYDSITYIKNGFLSGRVTSYATEMNALLKIKSCKTDVEGEFSFDNFATTTALGAKIDEALALNGVIVDKVLVNDYLIKVINKKVTLDGQYVSIKTNVTSRLTNDKNEVSSLHITSYASEFGYLSKLMNASDEFGTVEIETIKTATNTAGKTVAQCFDEIAPSVLVGDAGYIVIKNALSSYKDDSTNSDYLAITTVVCNNYDSLGDNMNFASNESGTKTYSYVNLIDALDEFYQAVGGTNKLTGDFTDIDSLSQTQAGLYDSTLNTLQSNIVVGNNGTLEITLYAMKKLQNVAIEGTQSKIYVDAYIAYLNQVKTVGVEAQPYNSSEAVYRYTTDGTTYYSTPTGASGEQTLQISKPFEVVYTLVNTGI